MSDNRQTVQLALRLPKELHAALKALADKERRSLHAQILVLIEEGMQQRADEVKIAA